MKKQQRQQRLTAIQTSRHFRMSHRQHTGHVLPRAHTSYPMLAMILLCVGVLLMSWTRSVNADSFVYPGPKQGQYDVHARVPGPPPTEAASIDDPADGDVFTGEPATVSGTCPPDTYVSLMRNGTFSGVGICEADGTYSIKTGLFRGVNELMAQVFSRTDQPGPQSNIVKITYNPPQPVVVAPTEEDKPVNTKTSDSTPKKPTAKATPKSNSMATPMMNEPTMAPLIFKSNYSYQGVFTGQATVWNLAIVGGQAPYAINVDWGDKTSTTISRAKAGPFTLQHEYKLAGAYKGSYTAFYTASDAWGNKTYMQLVTIVNNPPKIGAAGMTNDNDTPFAGGMNSLMNGLSNLDATPSYLANLIKYIWPSYGIVVLMLLSFWLGERRELSYIRSHPKQRQLRRRVVK